MTNQEKQNYTRREVIALLDELLQRPDILIDAIENPNTDYDGETLLEEADGFTDYEAIEEGHKFYEKNNKLSIFRSIRSKAAISG